ncbi:expressed unknown protein [Seminavis robusta]|uniref:Uncharacterized protein n=1 Tax=Seminavis robusta TaxID=568900 RepID=A0A9N8DU56_9STRA|nr:expressed unknown protein [Seminavis robusta]|eukprot:Sro353_g124540.1 n/a (272) ;mRNA; r:43656-44471
MASSLKGKTTTAVTSIGKVATSTAGKVQKAMGKAASTTIQAMKKTASGKNVMVDSSWSDDDEESEERNIQGLLTNLEKATRYSVLELRGLMASMTSSVNSQDFGKSRMSRQEDRLMQADSDEMMDDSHVVKKLQRARHNSILELRGMLASINTISGSITEEDMKRLKEESREEENIQGLLANLGKASHNSAMELRGLLASMDSSEFFETTTEEDREKIEQQCRESVSELRGLLVGLERVSTQQSSRQKSLNRLCESIKGQLQPLDELAELK